jgi:hypothetical protein
MSEIPKPLQPLDELQAPNLHVIHEEEESTPQINPNIRVTFDPDKHMPKPGDLAKIEKAKRLGIDRATTIAAGANEKKRATDIYKGLEKQIYASNQSG